jgi:hypothetical protein
MRELENRAKEKDWQGVLPEDGEIYSRLYSIKLSLEWVLPMLIRTPRVEGVDRRTQLMGYRHYVAGPLHALLYP